LSKAKFSKEIRQSCGNAETADTFLRGRKRLKDAQFVTIQEATLNYGQKTISPIPFLI